MKKLCVITTVMVTMDSFIVDSMRNLAKNGYEITLICNMDEEFIKRNSDFAKCINVPMERGTSIKDIFKSIKALKKIFKEEKFDLVQYATPNASFYASIASKSCKIPIRLYCQWGIRYVGFSGIKRLNFKLIEKSICKKSTNILAVSQKNLEFSIKEKLYNADKSHIIGHGGTIGVDLSKFDIANKSVWKKKIRNKFDIKESDFVFGFVGRISIDKGCEELLSAFKVMSQHNLNIKLLIVGPVEENLE